MMLRILRDRTARRCICTPTSSTFDVDLVNRNYAEKAERASKAAESSSGPVFRMVLPPPNVTGKLHVGHALTVTVEDAIARHNRLKGIKTTWYPGFDHAGIATQSVVERELWREKRITRRELSRDQFLAYSEQWATRNATIITEQLKMLGATLDWSNCYYTLDKKFSSAVTRAFCELHSQGVIFRSERLVNWCPALRSTLSDQEVDRIDVTADSTMSVPNPSGGKRTISVGAMYSVKYPAVDGFGETIGRRPIPPVGEEPVGLFERLVIRYPRCNTAGYLEVGTTRPETIFADVALAVHPSDSRYSKWIGKLMRHPISDRLIPVIADEAVLIDKGTGVVKITPAHDLLDTEIAGRHWDEILLHDASARERCALDRRACLINSTDQFDGLYRFDARTKVIEALHSKGLGGERIAFVGGQVSVCSRTGDVIEPRLTEQWFMDTKDMHEEAERALRDGRIRISPAFHEQKLFDWFHNTEPWCLSRQLLWGHRIPAYRAGEGNWVVSRSRDEARALLGNVEDRSVIQDKDVLDTWFSSALVPLVASGYGGAKGFSYTQIRPPLQIMETGNDILGFWVARMIIMTMRLTNGTVPFPHVLLHGLVRDSSGRKMSKSLGNVIDPVDVLHGISLEGLVNKVKLSGLSDKEIEVAAADLRSRYPNGLPRAGADALRFALLRHDITAADVPLDIAVLASEGLRFCNKLWNLAAYVDAVREKIGVESYKDEFRPDQVTAPEDKWLISRLHNTLSVVEHQMNNDCPHLAFQALHKFILANLCDVYLETTKRALWRADACRLLEVNRVLIYTVQVAMCQLSAFMPFVSEYMYDRVKTVERASMYDVTIQEDSSLVDKRLESHMECALAIVAAMRSVKAQLQLPQKMAFQGVLLADSSVDVSYLEDVITSLCDLRLTRMLRHSTTLETGYMPCPVPGHDAKLGIRIEKSNLGEFVDRLRKQLEKQLERSRQFAAKADKYEEIVERDRSDGKVKNSVIEKNERKARQARSVAETANREAERLRVIIADAEGANVTSERA